MTQKVVIKVPSMNGEKSRRKAMTIVVGFLGVESATLKQDKNQIEVTGDGMDAVALTCSLRKKMGYAEIVTLAPVKAKENEPKIQILPYHGGVPQYVYTAYPPYDPYYNPCSIL